MLRLYACIANDHDVRFLIVAGMVCFIAACTAFAVYDQATHGGRRRAVWWALAAFVSGTGIWSTHFIAMLAYEPNLPVGYEVDLTLASIFVAILMAGCGWGASMFAGRWSAPIGGVLIGLGIGTMHHLGMAGMRVPARIEWDLDLVITSLLLGSALSVIAVADHQRFPRQIPWRPALFMTLAICGLHFLSMAAVTIHPDPRINVPVEVVSTATLAVAVTGVALLILTISFAVVLFDRNIALRELKEAQRLKSLADEIERQAKIANAALDNMAQGLSMFDSRNRLITHNHRYVELYALPENLLAPGTPLADIIRFLLKTGTFRGELDHYLEQAAKAMNEPTLSEVELGSGRVVAIQRRPLPDGRWVATHEDITERRESAKRIAYLAGHDPLTDLPNRMSFGEHVTSSIKRLARGNSFALHTIDLDRFKEVNDTLGHPSGDEILRQVANRLRELVREGDHVTRLGGDEFAIVQDDIRSAEEAVALADRVITSLSEPYHLDGHTIAIGATVGISLAPEDGSEKDDLLKKSDLALYRAKLDSRGTYRLFEPGMDTRLRERRQLETELRLAIQEGQFRLHYQPILNAATQTITSFEALVRWQHPSRGMVQPSDFIPIAEGTGLIIPIGEWVLRQACRDAAGWPDGMRVAVNLSPAQFKRGDILAVTMNALAAAGLEAERLELEITESVLLHDEEWVLSLLERLRALGVGIAMDDFGTGYSSLSYLRSFPFSKIKIDRAFIADIAQTSEGLAIVQATIQLSRKLGMITTAEGVETMDQMSILVAEGCTELQGYHISQAIPPNEVPALIGRYSPSGVAFAA